jgi:hypothetical protein
VPDPPQSARASRRLRDALDAGPVSGSLYEAFLDAVLEEIAQSSDLSLFFVRDRNGLVAAEHLSGPAMQSTELLGEVRIEEPHEGGQLLLGVGDGQQVIVV